MVGHQPSAIVFTPDGTTAYVASFGFSNTVTRDHHRHRPAGRAHSGRQLAPQALAITPDGKTVLAVNYQSGTVSLIAVGTNVVRTTVKVGKNPEGAMLITHGTKALIVNERFRHHDGDRPLLGEQRTGPCRPGPTRAQVQSAPTGSTPSSRYPVD